VTSFQLTSPIVQAGIYIQQQLRSAGGAVSVSAIISAAKHVPACQDLDFVGAGLVAEKLGWNAFGRSDDYKLRFAESLYAIFTSHEFAPSWLNAAVLGRRYVEEKLDSVNQRQLLNAAGLLGNESEATQRWWAMLANFVRAQQLVEADASEYWLQCEQYSLLRENETLKNSPYSAQIVSIDDALLGYDIKSFRSTDNGFIPHFVEVKSCVREAIPRFFLSRNEWRFAVNHRDQWQLDFYLGESQVPFVLTFDQLEPMVPVNTECSRWQSVELLLEVSTLSR